MTKPTRMSQITSRAPIKGEIGSVPGIPYNAPPTFNDALEKYTHEAKKSALAKTTNAIRRCSSFIKT